MKTSFLLPSLILALLLAGTAFSEVKTESCLRFDDPSAVDEAGKILDLELSPEWDEEGFPVVVVPEEAMLYLREGGLSFEILWTRTEISGGALFNKSEEVAYGTNSSGFPINFRNQQHITIDHAPQNARVTKVDVSLSGMAAYADLCTFSVISSSGKRHLLPTCHGFITFKHGVHGIRTFNGELVNQRWTLEGQGSNTAGERVDRWTIGVYYKSSPPDDDFPQNPEGEGEWDFIPEIPAGSIHASSFRCTGSYPYTSNIIFEEKVIDGKRYVYFEAPYKKPPYNSCAIIPAVGVGYFTINHGQKRIELNYTHTVSMICLQYMDPFCRTGATLGPLDPGDWHFLTVHDHKNQSRPVFNLTRTVTAVDANNTDTTVPSLIGKSMSEACSLISNSGLYEGLIHYVHDDLQVKDHVIRQDPVAGANVPKGSWINLTLSLGPSSNNTTNPSEHTAVPNCVHLWINEISEVIRKAGLRIGKLTEEYHATIPERMVIRQNPMSNVLVKRDTTVDIVVSRGPEDESILEGEYPSEGESILEGEHSSEGEPTNLTIVPNCYRLPLSNVTGLLHTAELRLGATSEEYHASIPKDHVIRQKPTAGKTVERNTSVDVVLSRGPAPLVVVPDLVGMDLSDANNVLLEQGFELGTITFRHDGLMTYNEVLEQSPKGNSRAGQGSAIDLVLSQGPQALDGETIRLQNYRLWSSAEAQKHIISLGLAVGEIVEEHDSQVPFGRVIRHDPGAGRYVPDDAVVNLVISLGPPPGTLVPPLRGLSEEMALEALALADLLVGSISYLYDALVPAGHVVDNEPEERQWLRKGSTVDLVLSLGLEAAEVEGEDDVTGIKPEGEAVEPSFEGELVRETEGEPILDDQSATQPEGEEEDNEASSADPGPALNCSGVKSGLADLLLLGVALLVLTSASLFRRGL